MATVQGRNFAVGILLQRMFVNDHGIGIPARAPRPLRSGLCRFSMRLNPHNSRQMSRFAPFAGLQLALI
ncbi:hypothetical protein MESS2_1220035 [Mesorhizobium metallidurans STM 2683]|uniref:Uncharacterized protein n=1 Tax=Mesorhizobium metallidurans STM 2683 TaxID=1297569 RepID=M5EJB8_9HYPH|nr:hypothetical protein MESS2_1220035 [Mesorhizobium metallidurans STM 2683]